VLSTLPGTIVLYYGDELGMADVDVPVALRLDEMTAGKAQGRDRCRTPMLWSAGENAGFTTPSARPWLPIGSTATNVDDERADPGSVLNFWRTLAALRQAGRIGGLGKLERVLLDEQVWAYRVGEVTTVANLSDRDVSRQLPSGGDLSVLVSSGPQLPAGTAVGTELHLGPWATMVLAPQP
jgi:alpha-glucosidase